MVRIPPHARVRAPLLRSVYGLPAPFAKLFKNCVYLDFIENGFKWPAVPEGGYKSSSGDCCNMLCGKCVPALKEPDVVVTTGVKEMASA